VAFSLGYRKVVPHVDSDAAAEHLSLESPVESMEVEMEMGLPEQAVP
jgi:hypothetical protein